MAYLDRLIRKKKEEEKEKKTIAKKQEPPKEQEPKKQKPEEKPKKKPTLEEAKKQVKKELEKKKEEIKEETPKKQISPEDDKNMVLIDSYGDVKIYEVKDDPLPLYWIPVPHLEGPKRALVNTVREIATRVIDIDPMSIKDPERRRNIFWQKISDIIESSPELDVPMHNKDLFINAVVQEMIGYGILDPLVRDDFLEEIMVIGSNRPIFVFHRKYEMMKTNAQFYDDEMIRDVIDKIARQINRRIDLQNPLLDARLPDGTRVNATIKPASVAGPTITIRHFRKDPLTIIDMVNNGTMDTDLAAFLWICVDGLGAKPANILISGGTASGKTTTLNVLSSFVPTRERIITIEDTAELNLPLQHWVRLEARPPGVEGTGEVSLNTLMKNSLRMRPDRIIVGEIRKEEAETLFVALNTGHDGGIGTVHANSAQETIVRLTEPPMSVPKMMLSALDFIIVQHKIFDKKRGTIRRISEIAEVYGGIQGDPKTKIIYERDPVKDKIQRTSEPILYINTLCRYTGLSPAKVKEEIADRKKVLEELVKKNIRSMDKVSEVIQEYYLKKGGGKR